MAAAQPLVNIGTKGGKRRTAEAAAPMSKKVKISAAADEAPRSLITPHEALIARLTPKYHVLPVSVISSSSIQKRINLITNHLIDTTDRPRLVLLYARTGDVGKMISIVEHCKRQLGGQDKPWHQYNQMFDQPEGLRKTEVVEETLLEAPEHAEDHSDDEDDDYETMDSRIEHAIKQPPAHRPIKSLRILLALQAVPEMRTNDNVTVQTHGS